MTPELRTPLYNGQNLWSTNGGSFKGVTLYTTGKEYSATTGIFDNSLPVMQFIVAEFFTSSVAHSSRILC